MILSKAIKETMFYINSPLLNQIHLSGPPGYNLRCWLRKKKKNERKTIRAWLGVNLY